MTNERLENVEENQDEFKSILHQIPSNGPLTTPSNRMQAVRALFPLKDFAALKKLENDLESDKELRENIVSIF